MATEAAAQAFLNDHPDLDSFYLSNARSTGITIGTGSYGSVEEVEIPGAVCAAKKIHDFFQDPRQMPREGIEKAASEFVRECQLMSTLRHPHIVQFLGVCFLPGSRMPALVMEKLVTSLHDVLDPEPSPPTKPYIPDSLKCSVLRNVASGLAFLHSHSPPIIHRDLSARNILLNEGTVAKIADLGMARIVPRMRGAATMTKAPGASIYMPPEALEDKSRYDTSIDIFSMGIVTLFTLSQMFPDPLSAAFMDESGRMVGRTELQRRTDYMQEVLHQFRQGHVFVRLIQQCLKNRPTERPSIQRVQQWLEEGRTRVEDEEFDVDKLSLAQVLHSQIQSNEAQRCTFSEHIGAKEAHNHLLKEENDYLKKENDVLRQEMASQRDLIHALQKVHPFHWALSLNWRQGKVLHFDRLVYASSVVISGVLYCGGNFLSACDVIRLSPENRDWSQLPRPHIRGFAMTSLNGQLTIAGGREDTGIRMWDSDSSKWVHPYPPMSTDRWAPAAVGYQNYLIVACGFPNRRDVEVLDSFSGRWYIAQPMPVGGSWISSVVIGDCWYLSSYWKWSDDEEHIFWVHLPTLINSATSAHSNMQRIWCELPTPPVTRPTLLALQGHLLSVGGKGCPQEIYRYDKVASEWKMCGELPVGMCGPCCAVLPSGKVMVAGGITRDTEQVSRRMWLSNV